MHRGRRARSFAAYARQPRRARLERTPKIGEGTLEQTVRRFLDHLVVERGVSPHTASAYRRDLGRYVEYCNNRGVDDPRSIDAALINEFAGLLASGTPDRPRLSPASVARAIVAVRSLHRFAVEEGIVVDNVAEAVHPPGQGRRLPKALGLGEVTRLLAAPDTTTGSGLRDAALLELLYGTGARISEIVNLDLDDVARLLGLEADEASQLRVLGKGAKERMVPLGSYARAAVEAWLVRGRPAYAAKAAKASPALLLNSRGGRLSRQSAWAILRQAAETANLGVEISPHTLRHSFATHLLDGGADVRVVQELLGHASVTTTQIYTLVTVDHLRETYLTSHPRAY